MDECHLRWTNVITEMVHSGTQADPQPGPSSEASGATGGHDPSEGVDLSDIAGMSTGERGENQNVIMSGRM